MAESAAETSPDPGAHGGRVTLAVAKETAANERRVALVPDAVAKLVAGGVAVTIEAGAGEASAYLDDAYQKAGATVVPDAAALVRGADVLLRVQKPEPAELDSLRPGAVLVAFLAPMMNTDSAQDLARRRITAFSMDAIPRTTRAQSMDALSSQSTVAGYKAVLLAADHLPRFFPMLTTAAGSITPAKVLVVGAGVAGLQAIATARRLGAVVEAYDTRPVVKEQVESLGARFVDIDIGTQDTQTAGGYAKEASPEVLKKQAEVLAERAARSDVVITTALIPGRPAPRLITAQTVSEMRHGSVIVDLAAETGGNCELTKPGEIVVEHGVTLIGTLNLPSQMPFHASQMYSKNVQNLLALFIKDGRLNLNFDDDIVKGTVITHDGEVVHEATRSRLGLGSLTPEPEPAPASPSTAEATPDPATSGDGTATSGSPPEQPAEAASVSGVGAAPTGATPAER
ncbi:MAG: NAD(P) transhydrogenase alpha subunit [uncultured Thermomicrobiales bacterium]|uniref:NAD(P) transhydrogenase subunit alpha part 1 n=1 Tax=uncultured Thermomicrobiales bacterium TaxID=1645740 RepID=A0A6J4TGV9_9BACT|nr:MAG: NAD(P) transhydrogenase alpha subunit [uncultured Thermomicrobiales bacterium]